LTSKAPEAVEVFTISPAREFVELGKVYVRGIASGEVGLAALRQDAGKRGCDAIVVNLDNAPDTATCLVYR
jgi:hypothetical protein